MIPDDTVSSLYNRINQTQSIYPHQKTVMMLFEEQVQKIPQAIAIVGNDSVITYQELDEQANQVAHALHTQGVRRNCVVGIMVERSVEMLIGIYGIIKAGAAYLPIAPDTPIKRVEYMVQDSHIGCLLTHTHLLASLAELPITCIALGSPTIKACPTHRLDVPCIPSDLMYVIYTSGSTGEPKGVMITHEAVINRLHWMQRTYPLSAIDTILQKTSFIFDVSVWELFWWAMSGAKVSLLGPGYEKFPQALIESVYQHHITIMHFVPSMLNAFLNYLRDPDDIARLSSLRRVFCSGEALLPTQVTRFYTIFQDQQAYLTNLYGPTEATIDVSFYDCPTTIGSNTPIGYPIDNTTFYIVRDGLLQPVGQVGELYIGGVGLARGYLNRPDLTAEKFMPNPFLSSVERRESAHETIFPEHPKVPMQDTRLYKTGDYAYLLPDGSVVYKGRIDDQVKIRGMRVELGEIESILCTHQSIEQAVVLCKRQDWSSYLVAYILTHDSLLTDQLITQFLQNCLPDYMIPSQYELLDHFPVKSNGKVDRHTLAQG